MLKEGRPFFHRVELRGGGDAKVAAKAVLNEGTVDYAWNLQVAIEALEELEAEATMESPEPVRRVTPPSTTMAKTSTQHTNNHQPIGRSLRALAAAASASLDTCSIMLPDDRIRSMGV